MMRRSLAFLATALALCAVGCDSSEPETSAPPDEVSLEELDTRDAEPVAGVVDFGDVVEITIAPAAAWKVGVAPMQRPELRDGALEDIRDRFDDELVLEVDTGGRVIQATHREQAVTLDDGFFERNPRLAVMSGPDIEALCQRWNQSAAMEPDEPDGERAWWETDLVRTHVAVRTLDFDGLRDATSHHEGPDEEGSGEVTGRGVPASSYAHAVAVVQRE